MGKLDELMRTAGGNVDESHGGGRGLDARCTAGRRPSAAPARWQGVAKARTPPRSRSTGSARTPTSPARSSTTEALGRLADSLRPAGPAPADPRPVGRGQGGRTSSSAASGGGGPPGWPGWRPVAASSSSGPIAGRRAAGHPARRERPPRGPQADRAGPGLPGADGRATAGRARQVAGELAVDQSSVVRALALLELPAAVQEQVERGRAAGRGRLRGLASSTTPSSSSPRPGGRRARPEPVRGGRGRPGRPGERPAPHDGRTPSRSTWETASSGSAGARASAIITTQALRQAIKEIQDRERSPDQAA